MHTLDHVGIAVLDLEQAIAQHQRSFGFELGIREIVSSQNVELAFLILPNTKLELLAPLNADSALGRFLDKRGPGLHHLCYEVSDIRSELARLKQLGHKLIDETPRPGAGRTEIAFVHPAALGGVLIELCQYSAA